LVQIAVVALAAVGLDRLMRWGRIRALAPWARAALAGALIAGILAGLDLGPMRLATLPDAGELREVYQWLARQDPSITVLELPFTAASPGAPSVPQEEQGLGMVVLVYPQAARYQYASLFHRHPLVNGHSGYVPPFHRQLSRTLKSFPDEVSLEAISVAGAELIIIHRDLLNRPALRRIEERLPRYPRLQPVVEFGPDLVLRLTPAPRRSGDSADPG
jgi:hypothetical protein